MKLFVKTLLVTACMVVSSNISLAQGVDANLQLDRDALAADLANIGKMNKNVHIYYVLGTSPLRQMMPERMEYVSDLLSKRVAQMDKTLSGEALNLPKPSSILPGPPGTAKRHQHPRGPKPASFPHKTLKKGCYASDFQSAGFDQGVLGNDFKGAYKRDKKVCGSVLKKGRTSYEAGYSQGVAAHCGYERGFLIGRNDNPTYAFCDDQGFQSYEKGKAHAKARKPYMDAYWDIADQADFTSYTNDRISIVARIKAGDTKNAVYRKARKARFKRERARFLESGFKSLETYHPWVAAGPRSHDTVVADAELKYSIPQ